MYICGPRSSRSKDAFGKQYSLYSFFKSTCVGAALFIPLSKWSVYSVLQIEEEKQRKRQAKKAERAQKRKKEKEPASKETEPKVKRVRQVKGTSEIISLLGLTTLRLTYTFFALFSQDVDTEKQTAPDKNSKQYLCSELNKVSPPNPSQQSSVTGMSSLMILKLTSLSYFSGN